jgi:pyruvate dehydrogenase E2 component (dihydrolipoamide acetyltransferase)
VASQREPGRAAGPKGEVDVVELSQAQQGFARRAAESKATAPHVYFSEPVSTPTTLARLVHACARALAEQPLLNGAYRDGRVELHSRVNIAVGVELDGTLAFPVVRDADQRDPDAIAAAIEELSEAARDGSLSSPSLAGATFTVIDMSASGVSSFTPVVARGQAATLGAGGNSLTLACDNRVVQGSEGATFLSHVVAYLARP